MTKGKNGEFWIVSIGGRKPEPVYVAHDKVYPCGDEQGWSVDQVETWVRRIKV